MNRRRGFLQAWAVRAFACATLALAAVAICSATAVAQQPLPALRQLQGALVTPAAAHTYYASQPGAGDTPPPPPGARLRSLARALENDPDRIYEFVRNGIAFEPIFGLHKGGEGAWLDRSGGAFDQAQLLSELLETAGYPTRFVLGEVALPASLAASALRTTTAAQACATLAAGGTPAIVNGVSDCGLVGGELLSLRMLHVWVEVTIDGQPYVLDPSLKSHQRTFGQGLWDAFQVSPAGGWAQTSAGLDANVSGFGGFDAAGSEQSLRTYTANLLQRMRGDLRGVPLDQWTGGWRLIPAASPRPRQAVHPYAVGALTYWSGDIPAPYRARLAFSTLGFSPTLDLASLYPQRVQVQMVGRLSPAVLESSAWPNVAPPADFRFQLEWRRCEGVVNETLCRSGNIVPGSTLTTAQVRAWDRRLSLTIDHPFAAANGTYADETVVKSVQVGRRFDLVLRSGGGSGERYAFHRSESDALISPSFIPGVRPLMKDLCPPGSSTPCYVSTDPDPETQLVQDQDWYVEKGGDFAFGEHGAGEAALRKDHAVNLWAALFDRGVRMLEPLSAARVTHLHSLGVSSTPYGRYATLDVDTAVAVAPGEGSTAAGTPAASAAATLIALAAASTSFEAAALYQINGERWDDGLIGGTDAYASSGAERLVEARSASGVVEAGGDAANFPASVSAAVRAEAQRYLNAGYEVAAVEAQGTGGLLARRLTEVAFLHYTPGGGSDGFDAGTAVDYHLPVFRKGAAPDPLSHLGADQARAASQNVAPTQLGTVNLRDGSLSFSEAPDVDVGQGEFPYSLQFVRSYASGGAASGGGGMGPGWSHNWTSAVTFSSDALALMPDGHPAEAAPTLVALTLALEAGRRETIEGAFVAGAVMNWWAEQVPGNSAQVSVGSDSARFVRQVDGSWRNSAAPAEQLTSAPFPADPGRTQWTRRLSDGSLQTFLPVGIREADNSDPDDLPQFGYGRQVALTRWAWPSGVAVTLEYAGAFDDTYFSLVKVSNNLGVEFSLTHNEQPDLRYCASPVREAECYERGQYAGTLASVQAAGPTGPVVASFGYLADCQRGNSLCQALLTTVDRPDRRQRTYIYSDALTAEAGLRYRNNDTRAYVLLSTVRDANIATARARFEWDVGGWELRPNVVRSFDAQNRETRYFTTGGIFGGALANVTAPEPSRYRQTFDEDGRLTASADPVGRVSTTAYHPAGWVSAVRTPWGDVSSFAYDERGNLVTRTQSPRTEGVLDDPWWRQSVTVTAEYHPEWNKPTRIVLPPTPDDPVNRAYTIDYVAGEVFRITAPPTFNQPTGATAAGSWETARDAWGRPIQETDPTGRVTSHGYGESLQPLWCRTSTTVDPGGLALRTRFGCDPAGNQARVDDPRGYVTLSTFDSLRRLVGTTGPLAGMATQREYDLNGDLRAERRLDQTGQWQTTAATTYSPTGRALTTTDAAGDATRTCYDALDRPVITVDGEGRATRTSYNSAGDVVQIQRWLRASVGDPTCATTFAADKPADSPAGVWRTFAYNDGGLLGLEIDARGGTIEHRYDGLGRRIQTTHPAAYAGQPDGERLEQFLRNERGELVLRRLRSPAGESDYLRSFFDPAGREVHRWEFRAGWADYRGRNTRTFYDLAGRVTYRDTGDQPGGAFSEGAVRQKWSGSYDAAGRLTYESTLFDAVGRPGVWRDMLYGYDASSNRTSIVWHDGFNVAYQYDGADRMTRAAWAGGSSSFAHDVMSRPVEQTRENSYGTGWGWQADDDLETIVHYGLGTLTHGYNAAGQVTVRTSTASAFEWEPPAGYARAYGDPNPRNQVTGEAGAPIVFDPSGAMVYDGATTYGYDLADRLVSASGPLGSGTYLYDAQGRRDRRTINGTFTLYTLWRGEEEVAEYDADLNIRYRFVPGPGVDRKIAVVGVAGAPSTAQPTRYLHADAQGSVLAATTETGLIPRLTAYSPWGEVAGTPPDAFGGLAWGYAGRPHDPETGLVYVRARYYSPRLGQWLTPDPIGTEDDPNLYLYVGLDPVNGWDPTGQTCEQVGLARTRRWVCRVDGVVGRPNQAQLAQIEEFNRSYSDAVNRLARDPGRATTVQVPQSVGGRLTGRQVSLTVNSGVLMNALVRRRFVANLVDRPTSLADTRIGRRLVTTVYQAGLRGRGSTSSARATDRMETVGHEGIHGSADEYRAFPLGPIVDESTSDPRHGAPYDRAVRFLLGISSR